MNYEAQLQRHRLKWATSRLWGIVKSRAFQLYDHTITIHVISVHYLSTLVWARCVVAEKGRMCYL